MKTILDCNATLLGVSIIFALSGQFASVVIGMDESNFLQAAVSEWKVPLAGNSFRTLPQPSNRGFGRDTNVSLTNPDEQISTFFRVDQAAMLELTLTGSTSVATELSIGIEGEEFSVQMTPDQSSVYKIGEIQTANAGYVRVDFRAPQLAGRNRVQLSELIVSSRQADLQVDFVGTNQGNMFYWGRRGPSIHLTYSVPRDVDVEYAYSEIRVNEGDDPIGSYFMANGFGEGYFGIQVNSETERRVLFSVWSPFQTDNPADIPVDQRIESLARGPEVTIGEFGNEGSGGQSYLVYPWKAGRTYRFLTQVVPTGDGSTIYTSWFGDKGQDEWRLIASFRRPKTDTHLKRFHSFLENFNPAFGHLERTGHHGNVWVRTTAGEWHQCNEARFSVDATGNGNHRLDFAGGSRGNEFYMRNGGFFADLVQPGTRFTREPTSDQPPTIDFENLPKK